MYHGNPNAFCKATLQKTRITRIPTVDGRNPAPVDRQVIPLFTRLYTSQLVQDFFHQQYVSNGDITSFFTTAFLAQLFPSLASKKPSNLRVDTPTHDQHRRQGAFFGSCKSIKLCSNWSNWNQDVSLSLWYLIFWYILMIWRLNHDFALALQQIWIWKTVPVPSRDSLATPILHEISHDQCCTHFLGCTRLTVESGIGTKVFQNSCYKQIWRPKLNQIFFIALTSAWCHMPSSQRKYCSTEA